MFSRFPLQLYNGKKSLFPFIELKLTLHSRFVCVITKPHQRYVETLLPCAKKTSAYVKLDLWIMHTSLLCLPRLFLTTWTNRFQSTYHLHISTLLFLYINKKKLTWRWSGNSDDNVVREKAAPLRQEGRRKSDWRDWNNYPKWMPEEAQLCVPTEAMAFETKK